MGMAFDEVVELIREERGRQDLQWGGIDSKQQSVAGYMLILKKKLDEAEEGWMKNIEGSHSSLSEIKQVAAVAFACLQQYGDVGNPL